MTTATATEVVDSYQARAPFARAETAAVTRPRLLHGLLTNARHVAELPSGAGHFLTDYSDTGAEVTLIDGNAAMLAAAFDHAITVGLAAGCTHGHVRCVQELGTLPVDLVVMPNAALNQVACQTPLVELLSGIRSALPPGVALLAQVLCTHPDAFAARCRSVQATVTADCLTGHPVTDPHLDGGFELVTQFGLLGLCRDERHFADCFTAAHRLLAPGGWAAGANWVARDPVGRVELTESLYRRAAARAGIDLLLTLRVRSADSDFPAVFTYLGRKRQS